MIETIGEPGKSKYNPKLAARLNKLAEQGDLNTEKNATVEDICKNFEYFMEKDEKDTFIYVKKNITKETLLEFSRKLPDFSAKYEDLSGLGLYYHYLIRDVNEKDLVIDLTGLNIKSIYPDNIGFSLKNKKLTIYGSAGHCLGNKAIESEIIVGNAGQDVGREAHNCKIFIKNSFGGLSDQIGRWTQIFQWNSTAKEYDQIHPKI